MNVPPELSYTNEHEWVRLEGNVATIGITDYAQGELGDIIFVEFPEIGQELVKDDPFGTIEAVKTVADLFAPVSGKITELNTSIEDNPELLNEDNYGKGWLVKIKMSEFSETEELLSADQYTEFIS